MTITQTADYYPFGMRFSSTEYNNTADNKYLYNSKELQDDQMGATKLDWYDYGKRFYDPQIGRFTGSDPLADKFLGGSPYNYAENSPIANIDFWGLQKVFFQKALNSDKAFQKVYNIERQTSFGKQFSQVLKNQDKYNVMYFKFDYFN